MLFRDPQQCVEDRVEDLLARMNLQEKIGQMTQIERSVATAETIRAYNIGSVLSGGGSSPGPKASPLEWACMVDEFQRGAMSTRLGIPLIYGTDAVHGHNNVYSATIFPHNIGLSATRQVLTLFSYIMVKSTHLLVNFPLPRDCDLVQRIGIATALEVRATGIPFVFAPCVSVCRDPRWGRCYESFGECSELVNRMAISSILGLQGTPPSGHPLGMPYVGDGTKVAACAKHYVGDGETVGGINEGNTMITMERLLDVHASPFVAAVSKGICCVMVAFSSWHHKKMHGNKHLITGILKEQMGFKGFTISDYQGVDKMVEPPHKDYSYCVFSSLDAGIDMIMVPYDYKKFIDTVNNLVKVGKISEGRIDDAVRRILRVKFIAKLFEHPSTDRSLTPTIGNLAHRELAREAVRKSLVLLKNRKKDGRPLLPLSKHANKILVTGTHANNLGYQCGGWTIDWQGNGGNITKGTTILEAIRNTVSARTEVVYNEDPDPSFVREGLFSYAVVVIGEMPYAESEGDDPHLELTPESIKLIQSVTEFVECLVIMLSGRPLVLEPFLPIIDAFVAAWLPGTEGQGIADVIFGDFDFQGNLPRTWFKRVDQLPMNYDNDACDPLFPIGFGLNMSSG